ncbi:MAG: endonuclease/exonuclease/phosphatase family protein [Chloroflexota bacterium]|nr:endonuclease/exonuclease/phosphatase family protein [Chloroflexota bacterium]
MDVERLAVIIEESGADIVSLNEVLHPVYSHSQERWLLAELAELLRMKWAFGESGRIVQTPGWWGPIGNAVLSRQPIESGDNYSLPSFPLTQNRNLLITRTTADSGRAFTIYSTHLDHAFEGTRLWQIRGVLDQLRSMVDTNHLLMGDFNTPGPTGPNMRRFAPPLIRVLRREGYVDAFLAAGRGDASTFYYGWPFRIDYIFVPQPIAGKLVSCRTLSGPLVDLASDHRPLLAEFDWSIGH